MGVGSEAWAVVGWKSTDETVQEREGSVGDSAGLVGEGVEVVGEVAEGGTPGLVFGGDAGSVGSAGGRTRSWSRGSPERAMRSSWVLRSVREAFRCL